MEAIIWKNGKEMVIPCDSPMAKRALELSYPKPEGVVEEEAKTEAARSAKEAKKAAKGAAKKEAKNDAPEGTEE